MAVSTLPMTHAHGSQRHPTFSTLLSNTTDQKLILEGINSRQSTTQEQMNHNSKLRGEDQIDPTNRPIQNESNGHCTRKQQSQNNQEQQFKLPKIQWMQSTNNNNKSDDKIQFKWMTHACDFEHVTNKTPNPQWSPLNMQNTNQKKLKAHCAYHVAKQLAQAARPPSPRSLPQNWPSKLRQPPLHEAPPRIDQANCANHPSSGSRWQRSSVLRWHLLARMMPISPAHGARPLCASNSPTHFAPHFARPFRPSISPVHSQGHFARPPCAWEFSRGIQDQFFVQGSSSISS